MKKLDGKRILKSKYFIILITSLLVGVVVTCVVFFKDSGRNAAVSSILFSFDGAADGCTPDGEEFDVSAMADDAILEAALEQCNMSGKYAADALRSSLYIRGEYPENIASEILSFESMFDYEASKTFTHDGFHATQYTIALYNDFDRSISKAQLNQLLTAILKEYGESFKTTHGKTWQANLLKLDLDDYDYIQQLAILENRMDEVSDYAMELYQKNPGIITGGEGFNDIAIKMDNLSDNEIPRLQALVIMGGLSKNYERLLIQYEYEIEDLCVELKYQSERLTEVEKLLNSYEKNDVLYISSGEELVKIDGNSSQTYDKLVAERRNVADGITGIKSDISERLLRMQDILGDEAGNSEVYAKVNEILADQMGEEQYEQLLDGIDTEDQEIVDGSGEGTGEPEENPEENLEENPDENSDTDKVPEDNTQASIHKGRGDMTTQIAALEADIKGLEEKVVAIEGDFSNMLIAYNEMQLNDTTISLGQTQMVSKEVLSGAFIKTGIKCAGPFVSIGIMICVVMVLLDKKKKEKNTEV
ncbi:MAG: hypothetical protein J6O73_07055 [Lachnospiraceae bacterium]|nr:hypothetical protein [Lachnospiraceae bacterium]